MALSSGSKLGPYEILAPIGAGGMGEVYRAKDTRLDRIVAIKVLPSHLSTNPNLKQRFEREARTISSLSHPNICALYDIGHQDGTDYLVMEYLEGESMAHRLDKGALPTEQVLRYGIEICQALDKAHRQGIVHRDLKPGNIMLTKSGAKLLDFGLAKYHETKTSDAVQSELETRDKPLTEEGVVLGTVQYMAPEQLEGKEADKRTDIFALGEVLYEMATGQRTFKGNSKAQLMAAILSSEPPPISTIQPLAPPALDHVVKKCLAKDPEDRWQDAGDVAGELKWISEAGSQAGVPTPVVSRRKTRERIYWGIISTLVVALCVVSAVHYRLLIQPARPFRFSINAPEGASFTGGALGSMMVAVSQDGSKISFAATSSDGSSHLWIRDMDSVDSKQLAGTEGATFPFWSPDSRKIGFFADEKLKTIDLAGTQPQILCDAQGGRGGAWSPNGVIVFAPAWQSSLYRVSETGGTPTPVTTLDNSRSENAHRYPHFLPDGHHFLYLALSGLKQNNAIYAGSLDSKERKLVLSGDSSVAYATGHLIFVRDQTLVAQDFDPDKIKLSREPFPIAENVGTAGVTGPFGYSPFSVSEQGVLAYGRVQSSTNQLTWFDRSGKELEPAGPAGSYTEPYFSPDQKRVAVNYRDAKTGSTNIWLLDLSRRTFFRFTFGSTMDENVCWAPDGSRIVFDSNRLGRSDLYQKAATGVGNEELLLKSDLNKFCTDWTRDGRYIVFETRNPKNKYELWVLPTFGDKKPFPILQSEFNADNAQVSPDSHWIAYASDESGKYEIYIRPFPNTAGGKWQVSTSGGDQPQWRSDGKELFYLSLDAKLMAVQVQISSTFEASMPVQLFQAHGINTYGVQHPYLISSDGQRFLINKVAENSTPITVVVNWPALLKR